MAASEKMPLKQKILFFAVLIIGAIIWKFGADFFVKSSSDKDESPTQVEHMEIRPL